jgi:divalent metal cation (Fe/Co/Zn/Cd) transporter
MKTIFRVLLSLLILFVGYEWMVEAFDRLNQPSDRAVYIGVAMLALLGVTLPVGLWRLWRK